MLTGETARGDLRRDRAADSWRQRAPPTGADSGIFKRPILLRKTPRDSSTFRARGFAMRKLVISFTTCLHLLVERWEPRPLATRRTTILAAMCYRVPPRPVRVRRLNSGTTRPASSAADHSPVSRTTRAAW